MVACRQARALEGEAGVLVIERQFQYGGHFYRIRVCRQCPDPECAKVCPQEALAVRDGIVFLDGSLCTGCGLCAAACPYGAVQVRERAAKCNMCTGRPGKPPCVRTCPTGALSTGGEWKGAQG